MASSAKPEKTTDGYQDDFARTLHALSIEIARLNFYQSGDNPQTVPTDLFDLIVADDEQAMLLDAANTVMELQSHTDILTPYQSSFCAYRILQLSAQEMVQQYQSVNASLAAWMADGWDMTAALHHLTQTDHHTKPVTTWDQVFYSEAECNGLQPHQAHFALSFMRQKIHP